MDLEQLYADLMDAFNAIKSEIKGKDKYLYERWKAGGFMLDNTFISMYPNLDEIVEKLTTQEEEDEDE